MSINRILALQTLGYTQREASFLYLVAVHSGYFLRRQFDFFIQRKKGSLSHRFTEKGRIAGHIEVIDYQGCFVHHLRFKPIYELVGSPKSQNQVRKGDAQIRARLMTLDYVLENNTEHFLGTDQEKFDFFVTVRGVNAAIFTDTCRKLHLLLGGFPISVADSSYPASSVVRFTFIDEGLLTVKKFGRFLTGLLPLLDALGKFEIIYVALSPANFGAAEKVFRQVFYAHFAERQRTFAGFPSDINAEAT